MKDKGKELAEAAEELDDYVDKKSNKLVDAGDYAGKVVKRILGK